MATETTTAPAQERTAQVRIHLKTRAEDIQLPDTGPILVSTGKRWMMCVAHMSLYPSY